MRKVFMLILSFMLMLCLVESARSIAVLSVEADAEDDVKVVALTFDDGPHIRYTEKLLEGLRERGIKATFFLIGESIEGKEDVVRQMKKDGHLIGNHTDTHVQLTLLSEDAACAEIWKSNTKIYDVTGEIPTYIRPPFGSWDEDLGCAIDMTPVFWNVDPLDWKYQNADRVVKHVVSKVESGDIILMHDVYESSVEAALKIVDILLEKGYEFVTVEELIFN